MTSLENGVLYDIFRSDFLDSSRHAPKLISPDPLSDDINFNNWIKAFSEAFHHFCKSINQQYFRQPL